MPPLPDSPTSAEEIVVRSSVDVGTAVRHFRTLQELNQLDLAGLANTGNRFIVELEQGKPTIQLQKALEILQLLGLELVIRKRGRCDVG